MLHGQYVSMAERDKSGERRVVGPELVAGLGSGARFSVWVARKKSRRRNPKLPPPLPSERRSGRKMIARRYELVARLGVGSMGEVWSARDQRERRNVALKLLRKEVVAACAPQHASEPRVRFMREAMTLSRISSPHVVELYDWGHDKGTPYMAMELVQGTDLRQVLSDCGRMSAHEVSALVSDTAQGLNAVHRAGVVHRDLKPSNIMLCEQAGERAAKLVDFGVARPAVSAMQLTGARMLGTAHYMSPEQVTGSAGVDFRSDLWALGVIAFRALTGYMPFDGRDMSELIGHILDTALPTPSVLCPEIPESVNWFFTRVLAKDPAERFSGALEMADAFNNAVAPLRSGEYTRTGFEKAKRREA